MAKSSKKLFVVQKSIFLLQGDVNFSRFFAKSPVKKWRKFSCKNWPKWRHSDVICIFLVCILHFKHLWKKLTSMLTSIFGLTSIFLYVTCSKIPKHAIFGKSAEKVLAKWGVAPIFIDYFKSYAKMKNFTKFQKSKTPLNTPLRRYPPLILEFWDFQFCFYLIAMDNILPTSGPRATNSAYSWN